MLLGTQLVSLTGDCSLPRALAEFSDSDLNFSSWWGRPHKLDSGTTQGWTLTACLASDSSPPCRWCWPCPMTHLCLVIGTTLSTPCVSGRPRHLMTSTSRTVSPPAGGWQLCYPCLAHAQPQPHPDPLCPSVNVGGYIQAVLDRNLAENISRVLYPNDNVRCPSNWRLEAQILGEGQGS